MPPSGQKPRQGSDNRIGQSQGCWRLLKLRLMPQARMISEPILLSSFAINLLLCLACMQLFYQLKEKLADYLPPS